MLNFAPNPGTTAAYAALDVIQGREPRDIVPKAPAAPLIINSGNPTTLQQPSPPPAPQPQFNTNNTSSVSPAPQQPDIANSINSRFDKLLGFLDQRLAGNKDREAKFLSQAEKDLASSRGELEQGRQLGLANLNRSGEKIQSEKARTLSELDANIRNAFNAGAIRLGNLGAADSSASGQLGFALTKLQNQNRGNILRDTQQQNLDLDLARNELQTNFAIQVNKLKNFYDKERLEIADNFQTQRDLIEAEKANADFDRQEALDNLALQLAQQAAAAIQNSINTQSQEEAKIGADFSTQLNSLASTGVGELLQPVNDLVNRNTTQTDQLQGNTAANVGFNLQGSSGGINPFVRLPVRGRDESQSLSVGAPAPTPRLTVGN